MDTREKLEEFLGSIESGIGAGLVTLEKAFSEMTDPSG